MRGHVRKRGARWYAVLYLGKAADGRKHYRWISHATKRQAEQWLAQAVAARNAARTISATIEQIKNGWVVTISTVKTVERYAARDLGEVKALLDTHLVGPGAVEAR